MAEDIKVDLEQNSKYRVAFELMEKIAYWESDTVDVFREAGVLPSPLPTLL